VIAVYVCVQSLSYLFFKNLKYKKGSQKISFMIVDMQVEKSGQNE